MQDYPDKKQLKASTDRMRAAIAKLTGVLQSLGMDQPGGLQANLDQLQGGANQFAGGSRQIADAVNLLVDQVKQLGDGLSESATFLLSLKHDAAQPSMGGFNIPAQLLHLDEFQNAAKVFISADGHSVRYLVQTKLNPFSTQAMDQVNSILATAKGAQPNTALSDAKISMAGYTVGLKDTRDYYQHDIRFIIAVTLLVVLLTLIVLLRAIVAPLYLVASVVVSYLSAVGIGAVVFQFILGQQLHWSVPPLAFVVLVAVGADYNMLLVSRMRDESPHSMRYGIIRTLSSTTGVLKTLGMDQPGGLQANLDQLQGGANQFAGGSRQIADAVNLLVDQVKQLGAGLSESATFLLSLKHDAAQPSMGGFNIPAQLLHLQEFQDAAKVFISADGHSVRYLVQTKLNPFSTDAMDQVNSILATAKGAQPNTTLSDAKISMAGYTVGLKDTRDYYQHDIRFIIAVTLLVVLLTLIVLLRAIVAPLYLVASVVVSYLSAVGIGAVVFQFILGEHLHWSVPPLAFVVLVAVGADYNMLLVSRMRDESPHSMRYGIIRTLSSTGGVITAAGLIFAASMAGLLFSSIGTVVQGGFVIGVGILLDTFLVRTITVPAIAALMGQANWWPSRLGPRGSGTGRTQAQAS